jgi:hypothetical protein
VSTANLAGHISTANLANLVSTANLANLVSTSYLNTQLGSTMTGISQNFFSSNIFTSSLTTSSLTFGTGNGFLFLPNTVMNSLSVGIIYVSTIVGFTPGGASGTGLVSTANLANLVSTSLLDTAFGSTLTSLGNEFTTNHLITSLFTSVSTITISANDTIYIDTFNNIDLHAGASIYISSSGTVSLNSQNPISIVAPETYFVAPSQTAFAPVILSSIIFADFNFSTSQITTDPTLTNLYWNGSQLNDQGGGGGGISQANLTSTVIGLGTVGYLSTLGSIGLFSTIITSSIITSSIQSDSLITIDSHGVIFGKPDYTSFSPIIVSSLFMGGGELTTDTTNNLYWNSSQVNSQRGFVTLLSNDYIVTTSDANITVNSIIIAQPYDDLGYGNTFWITLTASTSWTLNVAASNGARDIIFAYNIFQY